MFARAGGSGAGQLALSGISSLRGPVSVDFPGIGGLRDTVRPFAVTRKAGENRVGGHHAYFML